MTAATPTELTPAARRRLGALARVRDTRTLDARDNSLNLLRLVLSATVLVAHSFYIAGNGVGPHVDGENLGGWAVFGFFAISGYLITASRWSHELGTYLVHRVARIMPAFWVCLVVVAFGFAPLGYLLERGTLAGFLTTGTTPLNFVFANGLLRIQAWDVAGTPATVPYPGAWNGSLWSLYYEFLCYLVVGALGVLGVVRRRPWLVGVAFLGSVAAHAGIGRWGVLVGNNPEAVLLAKLLPLFLGGALLQVYARRVRLHWAGATAAAAVVGTAVWLLDGWGAQLTAPFLAYLIVWAGAVLPAPRLLQRHDVSYGVYIYAFPVQQTLALLGVHERVGFWAFTALCALATAPFAVASWLIVERPVMRWARRRRVVVADPGAVRTMSPIDAPARGARPADPPADADHASVPAAGTPAPVTAP